MENGDLIIYTRKPYFWRSPVKFFGIYVDGKIAHICNGTMKYKNLFDARYIPYVKHLPQERIRIAEAHLSIGGIGNNTLEFVNYVFGENHQDVLWYV